MTRDIKKEVSCLPQNVAKTSLMNHQNISKEKFKEIIGGDVKGVHFKWEGAYPYLIDVISYICTHNSDMVQGKNDDDYNSVTLSVDDFYTLATNDIDGERLTAKKAVYNMISKAQHKVMMTTEKTLLFAQPFIVNFEIGVPKEKAPSGVNNLMIRYGKGGDEKTAESVALANSNITIKFHKKFWGDVANKGRVKSLFWHLPQAFYSKVRDGYNNSNITLDKDVKEMFDLNNNLRNWKPIAFYKLFLHIKSHDNHNPKSKNKKVRSSITLDCDQVGIECTPKNSRSSRSDVGVATIRSKAENIEFLVWGTLLLHYLGYRGFLDGTYVIPIQIEIKRESNEVEILLQRNLDQIQQEMVIIVDGKESIITCN